MIRNFITYKFITAVLLAICISLIDALAVVLMAILLGSFTEGFSLPNYTHGNLESSITNLIGDIDLQVFICVTLIIKYFLVIIFQWLIFQLIYNERLELSKQVLNNFIKTAHGARSQTQSHDTFMRNYISGVDHVADNLMMSLVNIVKEFVTLALLSALVIYTISVELGLIVSAFVFFVGFGITIGKLIRFLGTKVTASALMIYEASSDLTKMAHYLTYAHRLTYFAARLTLLRKKQISILKVFGSLQASVQPIIELILVCSVLAFLLVSGKVNLNSIDISILLVSFIRLIPSGSRITASLNSINYSRPYYRELFANYNEESINQDLVECYRNNNSELRIKAKKELSGFELLMNKHSRIKIDGESGSGKTQMLYKIASSAHHNNIRLGFVEQNPIFFAGTILENVTLFDECIDNEIVKIWFEKLNLNTNFGISADELLNFKLRDNGITLSGGQRKKIALVRELIRGPELILLDELFAGLDYQSSSIVSQFTNEFAKDIPIIYTSHIENSFLENEYTIYMQNLEASLR